MAVAGVLKQVVRTGAIVVGTAFFVIGVLGVVRGVRWVDWGLAMSLGILIATEALRRMPLRGRTADVVDVLYLASLPATLAILVFDLVTRRS